MTDRMIADRARAAKAQALVVVLAQAGATSKTVPYLDDDSWLLAPAVASVREPSQATRDLVATWLVERERPVVDPFAGIEDDLTGWAS